jgi:hypothetical protein
MLLDYSSTVQRGTTVCVARLLKALNADLL